MIDIVAATTWLPGDMFYFLSVFLYVSAGMCLLVWSLGNWPLRMKQASLRRARQSDPTQRK